MDTWVENLRLLHAHWLSNDGSADPRGRAFDALTGALPALLDAVEGRAAADVEIERLQGELDSAEIRLAAIRSLCDTAESIKTDVIGNAPLMVSVVDIREVLDAPSICNLYDPMIKGCYRCGMTGCTDKEKWQA